jgi:hypothetical protein
MATSEPTSAKYQESFGDEFVQNSRFHINLSQEVIVITEDKFRLCLQAHIDRLSAWEKWLAPVSLFVTFLIVFATSTFRAFIFSPATWEAVFLICTVASAIWSGIAIKRAMGSDCRLDTLVSEVKKSSGKLNNPP